MKIDLKKLRNSGKTESSFCFEYSPEADLIDIPSACLNLPVTVTGKVTLTDKHSALIEGEVCFTINGVCTRCVEETAKTFVASFSQYVEENNSDGYSVVNDNVDLAKIVEDEIILNVPTTFLCSDDCKGICQGCGVNLNKDSCKCK